MGRHTGLPGHCFAFQIGYRIYFIGRQHTIRPPGFGQSENELSVIIGCIPARLEHTHCFANHLETAGAETGPSLVLVSNTIEPDLHSAVKAFLCSKKERGKTYPVVKADIEGFGPKSGGGNKNSYN